jgi:rod shape-determining protein MreD
VKPLLVPALLLALSFQVVALPLYRIGPIGPDFLLILVAYVAAFDRPRRALVFASAVGLLADALSADPWGTRAIGYLAPWGIFRLAGGSGWTEDAIPRAILLALATSTCGAARLILLSLAGEPPGPLDFKVMAGMALYNAFLGLAVFRLLDPFRARIVVPARRFPA